MFHRVVCLFCRVRVCMGTVAWWVETCLVEGLVGVAVARDYPRPCRHVSVLPRVRVGSRVRVVPRHSLVAAYPCRHVSVSPRVRPSYSSPRVCLDMRPSASRARGVETALTCIVLRKVYMHVAPRPIRDEVKEGRG